MYEIQLPLQYDPDTNTLTNITSTFYRAGSRKMIVYNDGNGDKLYFDAEPVKDNLRTLYRWDGTTLEAAPNFSGTDEIDNMAVFNNKLYINSTPLGKYNFRNAMATRTLDDNRLYMYDGNSTSQIKDFKSEVYEDPFIGSFVIFNNKLFFQASYFGSNINARIYSINTAGTITSEYRFPGAANINKTLGNLTIHNNELYFRYRGYGTGTPRVTTNHIYKYISTNNATNITSSASNYNISDMKNLISYDNGLIYQQDTGDGDELQYLNLSNNTVTQLTNVNDQGDSLQNNSAESAFVPYQGNIAPLVNAMNKISYVEKNSSATVINNALELFDVDNTNLSSAKISFLSGFIAGDTLSATEQHGITKSYNPSTGVLTLTGNATVKQYQDILRSVTFNPSATKGIRKLLFQATDSEGKIGSSISESAKYKIYVYSGTLVDLKFDSAPTGLPDEVAKTFVGSFNINDTDLGTINFKVTNNNFSTAFDSLTEAFNSSSHGLQYYKAKNKIKVGIAPDPYPAPGYLAIKLENKAQLISLDLSSEGWSFDDFTITGFLDGTQVAEESFSTIGGALKTVLFSKDGFHSVNEIRLKAKYTGTPTVGFDAEFDNFKFIIESSNEAPTVYSVVSSITVDEDIAGNVNLSASTFADTENDDLTLELKASAGKFTAIANGSMVSGSGTNTLTLKGKASEINTYLDTVSNIKYTTAKDASGTNIANFTVKVNDGTSNPTLATVKINSNPQNDAPTVNSVVSSITVKEDLSSNVDLSASNFSDVEPFNSFYIELKANKGTFTAAPASELFIIGSGSNTLKIIAKTSINSINTYLDTASNIKYTTKKDASGTNIANFTITASDGLLSPTLATVQINSTAVNDAPTVDTVTSSITVKEDIASNVDLSASTFSDIEPFNSFYIELKANKGTFTAAPASELFIIGSGSNTLKIIAKTSINSINTYLDTVSNIKYTTKKDASGTNIANFTVIASDGLLSPTLATVKINSTAINDAPTVTIGSDQNIGSGKGGIQQSINNFASMNEDGDPEVTQSISDYVVSEASDANNVVSGVDISNTGVLTFTPANNIEGIATINVQVKDNGGVTNNGVDISVAKQFTITVDTLAPTTTITNIDISDDTGISDSDFKTKTTNQTITASLSQALATGEKLYGSTNGGTSYSIITSKVSNTTISWNNAVLSGSSSIKLKVVDASNNEGNVATQNYIVDTVSSIISSVNVPSNKTYVANENLDFTVNTNENISVDITNGTPQIAITIGSTTRYATYQSGSGTKALLFRYTVQAGDEDINGISVGALSANGGTLKDDVGNDLTTTLDNIGNTSSILIDAVKPSIIISSAKTNIINTDTDIITFTLSENSSDFSKNNISISGASLNNFTQSGTNSKVYTATLTIDENRSTEVTIKVNASTFTDSVGNNNIASNTLSLSIYPSVKTYIPQTNATKASINTKLILSFSENLNKGTGNITIKKVSDDTVFETINVESSNVVIENPNITNGLTHTKVTITKTKEFDLDTQYYVQIDSSAFKDDNNQNYKGISDKTSWKFKTIDNIAPTITNDSSKENSTINVNENQNSVVDINATDANTGQTLTYTISGTDANFFNINENTGVITFKTAPNFEVKTSYIFSVKVTDNGGGLLSDNQNLTINIKDVNEAPDSVNNSFTIKEDKSKTFAASDFTFKDVDNADTLASIIITRLPNKGELKLNNNAVSINQTIPLVNIPKLVYTPLANENGTAYTTFGFKVNDGELSSALAYTTTINVDAVDDAPTIKTDLTNKIQDEDGKGFEIKLISSDIDNNLNTSKASYKASSSNENIAKAFIRNGKLIVVPVANAHGQVEITVTTTVNGLSSSKTFTYTINSVNDAPKISNIADISLEQSSSTIVRTIEFNISDDEEVTSLLANSSNENFIKNSNLQVSKVSSTKASLTYNIDANNVGETRITITAKDAGNLEYKESFTIDIKTVNDALCVENTKTALNFDVIKGENTNQFAIRKDLDFVSSITSICNSTITWSVDKTDIISNTGVISASSSDNFVIATATIKKGIFKESKPFFLNVLASTLSNKEILNKLLFNNIKEENTKRNEITSKLDLVETFLSKSVSWSSSDDNVITSYSGFVTRISEDKNVTLTATIGSDSKEFKLKVLALENTDSKIVQKDLELLTLSSILDKNKDAKHIKYNLVKPLPSTGKNGSAITWSSSNTSVITNSGDVLRDQNSDKLVILTARIKKGKEELTQEFILSVPQEKIENASKSTFKKSETLSNGVKVTTSENNNDVSTTFNYVSGSNITVESTLVEDSIKTTLELINSFINTYINTDGTTSSNMEIKKDNKTISSSLNVEINGSTSKVDNEGNLKTTVNEKSEVNLNKDGTVSHKVENNGVSSTAKSLVPGANVDVNSEGTLKTTAEVKQNGNNFVIKAIIETKADGSSKTRFEKVNLSTGERETLDSTISNETTFEEGNTVEVEEINGDLQIKINANVTSNIVIE